MANDIPFIPHEGTASNGIPWSMPSWDHVFDLFSLKTTVSDLTAYDEDPLDEDARVQAYAEQTVDNRALYSKVGPCLPLDEILGWDPPGYAVFFGRSLDSRMTGMYYTGARPLCDRPLFAQRGWKRRFPAVARTLAAQKRLANEFGESSRTASLDRPRLPVFPLLAV